jgi:hypothetical protein
MTYYLQPSDQGPRIAELEARIAELEARLLLAKAKQTLEKIVEFDAQGIAQQALISGEDYEAALCRIAEKDVQAWAWAALLEIRQREEQGQ